MKRRAFGIFGGIVALTGIQLLASCGDNGSTVGKRVELASSIEPESLSFVNAYGFQVDVTRALVSIGPLRYLEGAPVVRRNLFERLLGIRVAHAHPGHYVEGGILGEMLTPTSVDLTAGVSELTAGPGVSGTALSGRVSFESPAVGPFADELGDNVVLVEGTATLDSTAHPFRAVGRLEDVADVHGEPLIEGCEFQDGNFDSDGLVTLVVRPSVWLDQVDFTEVPESTDGEPVDLDPAETPHKAFARGLKKAVAYEFKYTPTSTSR